MMSNELKQGMILKGENLTTSTGTALLFLIFIKDITENGVTSLQFVMFYEKNGNHRLISHKVSTMALNDWDSGASIYHKTIPANEDFFRKFIADLFSSD
jgi:hypothetical protein